MLETTILEQLKKLPEAGKQDVLNFIDSLLKRQVNDFPAENASVNREHAFGIWQGKIRISEDFDAPLDDLNDYM